MKLEFKRNMIFMAIEVTLTNSLSTYSDIVYSTNKSGAWWGTTMSSYTIEFSFNDDFYFISNKNNI